MRQLIATNALPGRCCQLEAMEDFYPIRIAVAGVGQFGECHARTLHALPETKLTALLDRDPVRAERVAGDLGGVPVFQNMSQLAASGSADAVVIASRRETHAGLAREALAAGLHVLIEKPVGSSLAEVESLAALSETCGRVVMAGHICLFHSRVCAMLERVRRTGFRAAHFVRHRPARLSEKFAPEHPVSSTMVHDLYVLAQLAGNEEPILIEGFEGRGSHGRTDLSWATLQWNDGRLATLHAHLVLPDGAAEDGWDWMEVFGDGGYARAATSPQEFFWASDKAEWPLGLEIGTVHGRPVGMLAEELRAFAAACAGGTVPPGCRMQDAAQVQRWSELIMQSATQKTPC